MPAVIRATVIFIAILIGSALVLIGETSGGVRALEAVHSGSARHLSVLADRPGFGGFTWGDPSLWRPG